MLVAGGTAAASTASNAAFVGWAANVRSTGGYVVVDVMATFDVASQHLLNTVQMGVVANGGSFVQLQAPGQRGWAPANGTSSVDSLDSFVTLGLRVEEGVRYAAFGTAGDGDFTNYTPAPGRDMTVIAPGAGWYNTAPLSTEGDTVALADFLPGQWQGAQATRGVWVAHLVLDAATLAPNATISFDGYAGFRDAGSTITRFTQKSQVFVLPSPGPALFVGFGTMFVAGRRRRA